MRDTFEDLMDVPVFVFVGVDGFPGILEFFDDVPEDGGPGVLYFLCDGSRGLVALDAVFLILAVETAFSLDVDESLAVAAGLRGLVVLGRRVPLLLMSAVDGSATSARLSVAAFMAKCSGLRYFQLFPTFDEIAS
jgi:hypothetical protein